ncbi:hypothetical protein ABIA33_002253 [Streptacidiphilus sp. MAP12-16]|uniref:SHOCT domain-containing protein n=1 Tax=Streptacidiphilus sp. MAP12-16 TaxID=3156300 RepID=UPI003517ACB8
MAKPFRGVVNLDIRDSVPDWGPYEQPKAPPGSPNVLYIVLDDVGFGALGCYGGPIDTPNIDRIAANGLLRPVAHHRAVLLPTGRNLILAASFDKVGEDPPGTARGILSLYYGDHKVGEGLVRTQPGMFSIAGEGLNAGRDGGDAVTDDYPGTRPWAFTGGTLKRVGVDVNRSSTWNGKLPPCCPASSGSDRATGSRRVSGSAGPVAAPRSATTLFQMLPAADGGYVDAFAAGAVLPMQGTVPPQDRPSPAPGEAAARAVLAGWTQGGIPVSPTRGPSSTGRSRTMVHSQLAASYPMLNLFWTIAVIFLWFLWFMLLFRVIGDIFRDDTLSGWVKAGWSVFVVIVPFLGVFVYLIARGRGMGERELKRTQKNEEDFRAYVRESAGTGSHAEELARLADLKNRGDITDAEFQQAKAKVLA